MNHQPLRALLVCVDYADLLAITLPYNLHHFSELWVVTSLEDKATQDLVLSCSPKCRLITTNLFYADEARFNKFRAVEHGFDMMGREGWICNMDADVLWPKDAKLPNLEIGKLYAPLRHMFEDVTQPIPPEAHWHMCPVHRNVNEWAGYSQIFHATDPVLGSPPWHDTSWIHAGGADSFFQAKWAKENKIRPNFNVLHLGEAGQNWFGRATQRVDGTIPEGAQKKRDDCYNIWGARRARAEAGLDKFSPEKIQLG